MSSEFIEIQWTAGSIDEARAHCRSLVEEGLVACAQIIPWIESIYLWDNKLETSQESKVFLKTRREHFEKVKAFLLKRSKYDVPEIISLPIEEGNQEYFEWMREMTNKKES